MDHNGITRRTFVKNAAASAAGVMIVPRHVLGGPGFLAPSDRVNVAMVGAGGRGATLAEELLTGGQQIVALADVDFGVVERRVKGLLTEKDKPRPEGIRLQAAYAKARRYADFRRMLEANKDIDAVVVATPDHTHATIANAAMQLGKHLYVEKPLTYSIHEARTLRDTARRTGVVTQMGNQGHSSEGARRINAWIAAGAIGPVREVLVWTNRPVWPQGLPRPAEQYAIPDAEAWGKRNVAGALASVMAAGSYPKPEGLDWDLFLGPAPLVPYHPIYHPFNWRGWTDWGMGALGDMGAHLIDHPYWALGLTYPSAVEATSTPFGMAGEQPASYPTSTMVHYEFPARGAQPPVRMTWHDGGLMPARPDVLPDSVELERGGGVIMVGSKGILMHETYGRNPRLFPESLMEMYANIPPAQPGKPVNHVMNWVQAVRGEMAAVSPFDYAAPLTETMLLGMVALRTGQGRKIVYDADAMRVTNVPEANQYLQREYRAGWSL